LIGVATYDIHESDRKERMGTAMSIGDSRRVDERERMG